MEDLLVLKIKFLEREKYKKKKKKSRNSWESTLIKQATEIVDLSKIIKQNEPENEPYKKDSPKKEPPEGLSPEKDQVLENNEISIHYVSIGDIWDRNKIVVDNVFSFKIAIDITGCNDLEMEPQFVEECQHRNYWPMWLEAIQQN